ncbi:MAG: HAD hydrolase-like protein [Spirochaetia bacterium]|jgi:HAD superfamily hydrolase (TIGR01548 family)|nr:HAD hydrolase-like protein [Spirochaetia bacterium]
MKKLIIFDMDGVLIDVSNSYRDTVRKAVSIFLNPCAGSGMLKSPLFELADLAFLKQSGGLNNDWDLTHRVLTLLLSKTPSSADKYDRKKWDLSSLASFLAAEENPLEKLLDEAGSFRSEAADFYYMGDVGTGNIIKQIFQEVYLGPVLFETTYGFPPEFYNEDGFILREKLLVSKEILSELSDKSILAIATGRPAAEALYPVEKHGIKYFRKIITLDDCLAAEAEELKKSGRVVLLSKPHPYMLDTAAKQITADDKAVDRFYYVGDMPDDMIAAKKSSFPFTAVGVTFSAPKASQGASGGADGTAVRLKAAGADHIADTPEKLFNILTAE